MTHAHCMSSRSVETEELETRYQVQPSDKELHTGHIPLRTLPLPSLQNETTNVVINIIVVSS